MCKNICGRNIYVRSKFPCVRSSHDLCVCVRTHAKFRWSIGQNHKAPKNKPRLTLALPYHERIKLKFLVYKLVTTATKELKEKRSIDDATVLVKFVMASCQTHLKWGC